MKKSRKYQSCSNLLYIPFWIYSNCPYLSDIKTERKLYIPFWIYSNIFVKKGNGYLEDFTFHSGYIPMQKDLIAGKESHSTLHSILDIFQSKQIFLLFLTQPFTFHSGYIPIDRGRKLSQYR